MTNSELKENVLKHLGIEKIHPLHDAVIDEVCENLLTDGQNTPSTEVALISCHATLSVLHGLIDATFETMDADTITFNYRNQSFVIKKNWHGLM